MTVTSLVSGMVEQYDRLWDFRDRRVDGWFLMSSPLPTLLACLIYVLVVKRWGPNYMEKRDAFQLRPLIICYNLAQVAFSSWLFYEFGQGGWFHGHRFLCQPFDRSMDPMALRLVNASYWFYISKFTELFDTIFFVLRKKKDQISYLHVIHHCFMPFSIWIVVRFVPTGHETFAAILNSFVHIIMYSYYMLSAAVGPKYQKYLWWKKYITTLQLTQFVVAAYHSFQLLWVECDYPQPLVWWIGCQQTFFLAMFLNFYRNAYTPRRAPTIKED